MNKQKKINLALQGGGAQGAFTWGVLDQLLMDERVYIEAISGTSAGAVNAVVMASGMALGGREGAREALHNFWKKISETVNPLGMDNPWEEFWAQHPAYSPAAMTVDYFTKLFSPYQFNVLDINPLRDVLDKVVDFDAVRSCKKIELFINATHVRSGKIKIFNKTEITRDAVLASTCLPFLFQTVWVEGEPYWDGGFSGNPAIFPLIYKADSRDVVIVQINPLWVEEVPTTASDILDRMNEISFNSSLMREMRAIAFVSKLKDEGTLSADDHYKNMRVHMIEGEDVLNGLGQKSKLLADWPFLESLYQLGVKRAKSWLRKNHAKLGKQSTIDIRDVYL
jgi:NTE family protein